jgi:hypothetical protein
MGVIYYTSLMNIKDGITGEQVKLILGGMKNQELFLWNMRLVWNLPVKLNRKGVEVLDISKIGNVTDCIVKNWEYVSCRDMLRNMYVLSDKYWSGKNAKELFNYYRDKYSYGDYNFPFVSNNFDDYIVKNGVYPSVGDVNKFESSLDKVKKDVEKFLYLKIFNTLRNDYIEYLIFGSSIDVIPTFSHRGGIDFYINGIGFDQKVSRSVTNQFKKGYGKDWKDVAIENPYEVCRYLMMYGDEARFSNVPRLFVVDIDGDYELDGIEDIIRDINFDSPRDVDYVYHHKSTGDKEYSCPVICILLYR